LTAILRQKHIACIALLLWLMAGWAGVQGHLCFDGQEPPFSVYMDVNGGHLAHHLSKQPDQQHFDADIDVLQSVLTKLTKTELPVLLAVVLFLVFLVRKNSTSNYFYLLFLPSPSSRLRPPSRAPPAFPA